MTEFGYTAMCEQTPVRQLVADLVGAEEAGFDFSVMSDRSFPWLEEPGHSAYTWSVLGAAAQATEQLPLMTLVTCPIFRYHPAVVAQKAATMGVLSSGRFTLGIGAGENLNEDVVGAAWPVTRVRHERLAEAVQIIREMFGGGWVNFSGKHYRVEHAKLLDLPGRPVPIAIALSRSDSVKLAAEYGDAVITTEPDRDLVAAYGRAAGMSKPRYGQMPICYDTDAARAQHTAQRLERWARPGWSVMSDLPEPRSLDAASRSAADMADTKVLPCGPDVETYVAAARTWVDAGFTHLALVQVGRSAQPSLMTWAERELLPALRKLGSPVPPVDQGGQNQ
ncbi:MAG: TIGR03557 family F420-dependent LLM class oxidoreductase [Streptosporangiaceae bacterium]